MSSVTGAVPPTVAEIKETIEKDMIKRGIEGEISPCNGKTWEECAVAYDDMGYCVYYNVGKNTFLIVP